MKVSGSMLTILFQYIINILLTANNDLIHDIKNHLSKNFKMKDMGDTSYVIRIEILCNRLQRLLGLSRKTYIDKILE